jgi:hypothetical protein
MDAVSRRVQTLLAGGGKGKKKKVVMEADFLNREKTDSLGSVLFLLLFLFYLLRRQYSV